MSKLVVDYTQFDSSKLSVVDVKNKKNETDSFVYYDGKPFVLLINKKKDSTKQCFDPEDYFTSSGLKKDYVWDSKRKEFTNVATGEYSVSLSVYSDMNNKHPNEIKLEQIMTDIRKCVFNHLVKKGILNDDALGEASVSGLLSNPKVKVDGKTTAKVDPTKSPFLSAKCYYKTPQGKQYGPDTKIPAEDKTISLNAYTLSAQPIPQDKLLLDYVSDNKTKVRCSTLMWLDIGKLSEVSGKYSVSKRVGNVRFRKLKAAGAENYAGTSTNVGIVPDDEYDDINDGC